MIDPKKYGTAAEVAAIVGLNRQTLDMAIRRDDDKLEVTATCGGTMLVSVSSARKFKRMPPRRGPKPNPKNDS